MTTTKIISGRWWRTMAGSILLLLSGLVIQFDGQATLAVETTKSGPRVSIMPNAAFIYIDLQNPRSKALICQTEGDKPEMFNQLRWSGPNRSDNWQELKSKHTVVEEPTNSNSWELMFKNPTLDDAGVYYCHGTYHSSDIKNASIEVKFISPFKLECPERQFLIKGSSNTKITCQITGDNLKTSIYKDGIILQQDSRYKWQNGDSLVISDNVNPSDAGEYLIKATDRTTGERKEQTIYVEVHSKPEIALFDGKETGEKYSVEGEPTELFCNATGIPRPLVYWLDPKRRNLTSVGGYIVNPERGTLQINKINRVDDHGQFECVATNNVGSHSASISMTVGIRPNIISFDNKTVDENQIASFECRSSGDPQPTFSIRKHGTDQVPYKLGDGLTTDYNIRPEGGGSNVYVYRVNVTVNRSLYGLHYCNATNRAGTAEKVNQLFVNYKPDLSLTPHEQYVRLGKIIITCHIRAYPVPSVSWYIDNTQIIQPLSGIKTSLDMQTHIVTMMPPSSLPQFSRVVCKASNKMGITEQAIIPRYTTTPGSVQATISEKFPTAVKLLLYVPNDGGDRIKTFKYRLEGRTLDLYNPTYNYRDHKINETVLDASLNPMATYTIRNLLPYYAYKLTISAVNDVGEGDLTELNIETSKATRPERPVIIKPDTTPQQHATSGTPSEYQNGYTLRWSPPDLDNGGEIIKYIIRYNRLDTDSLDLSSDVGVERIIEQMNDMPLYAKLGPLEANRRYRIQLRARNRYGDSEPDSIVVYTTVDRPLMPEYEAPSLAWLTEPSTPTLIILLSVTIVLLILVELCFHFCFQIGITTTLRRWCCPAKANSVISDKTYT